jgi:hypothetical protein
MEVLRADFARSMKRSTFCNELRELLLGTFKCATFGAFRNIKLVIRMATLITHNLQPLKVFLREQSIRSDP